MIALGSLELDPTKFHNPGSQLREGRDLAEWLIRAAIARYVLAAYLIHGRNDEDFDAYFQRLFDRFTARGRPGDHALLRGALVDVLEGRLATHDTSFREWQGLYARMTDVNSQTAKPERLAQVQWADPVSDFFAPRGLHQQTPEMGFVSAGIAHLDAVSNDPTFAGLFWQTMRVRTLFYRHVVQRPMTPGLEWFIRFYGRIKPSRRPLERVMFDSAERVCGVSRGLRSLEVRTSPDPDQAILLGLVKEFMVKARQARRRAKKKRMRRCEYGLVLHFTKERGGGMLEGVPQAFGAKSFAEPIQCASRSSGYRFGAFYVSKRREALSFAWVLRSFPLSLQVLRGLDLCTDELGVPNWVFIPLIRHVRQAGMLASRLLRQELNMNVPPLRTTVHVGEDFVHLLSGLRRVDEAIRFVELSEGDRIGHALALGVDPREWSAQGGLLPIPAEDRMFDLVWEWNWYARVGTAAPRGGCPISSDRSSAWPSRYSAGAAFPKRTFSSTSSRATFITRACWLRLGFQVVHARGTLVHSKPAVRPRGFPFHAHSPPGESSWFGI